MTFAALYICSQLAKHPLKEQLFDGKTLNETTKRKPNLSITSKLSLISETFGKYRNFSFICTKVTDSVTLVTLNENITNLLRCALKKINLASPFWGCCFNQRSLLKAIR